MRFRPERPSHVCFAGLRRGACMDLNYVRREQVGFPSPPPVQSEQHEEIQVSNANPTWLESAEPALVRPGLTFSPVLPRGAELRNAAAAASTSVRDGGLLPHSRAALRLYHLPTV